MVIDGQVIGTLIIDTQSKATAFAMDEQGWSTGGQLGDLEKQINRMLIDAGVLGWLCGGVCREDVGVV